ncbi:hypothetical protein U1Q18_007442 [Sarracenia purpurea var. burkii]
MIASPSVALEGGAAETVAEKEAEGSVEELNNEEDESKVDSAESSSVEAEKESFGAAPIDQGAEAKAECPAGVNAFDSHKQGKPSVDVGLSVCEQHCPGVLCSKNEEETAHAP